jgi:hypothetical protein
MTRMKNAAIAIRESATYNLMQLLDADCCDLAADSLGAAHDLLCHRPLGEHETWQSRSDARRKYTAEQQ